MKYNITVKQFLKDSKAGNIDYNDFASIVDEKITSLKSKHYFQISLDMKGSQEKTLFGLPVSIKDNICVKGVQTTAGSKILEGYKPIFDATVVSKIRDQNGAIIGKTNQDEFGFGTFSTNSGWGIPKNPLDEDRSCGGSSGGAAGLTAALNVPHIALGQSTGGSISCPAAFCGVVGLTPTYGLVSRYGLIDYANSMDKIGPIGKTVYDVALMLSIIAGYDQHDSTSINQKSKDYTKSVNKEGKLKIAVPKEYFNNVDKQIEKDVWNAIKEMESQGYTYEEVSLPNTQNALYAYYILATTEASTNLARYSGMRYGLHKELKGDFNEYFSNVRTKGFGEEAKRRIILGTFTRMSGYRDAYYIKAAQIRTLVIEEFKKIFKKFDVIAAPTMPVQPPKFKEIEKLSPMEQYQMDVLTVPANLAGLPTISKPVGKNKLPSGLHLIGDHLSEEKIIQAAGEVND